MRIRVIGGLRGDENVILVLPVFYTAQIGSQLPTVQENPIEPNFRGRSLKTVRVGCTKTSVTTNMWCATSQGGYTLVTLPRVVTPYRDSVDEIRARVTYQKLVTR